MAGSHSDPQTNHIQTQTQKKTQIGAARYQWKQGVAVGYVQRLKKCPETPLEPRECVSPAQKQGTHKMPKVLPQTRRAPQLPGIQQATQTPTYLHKPLMPTEGVDKPKANPHMNASKALKQAC